MPFYTFFSEIHLENDFKKNHPNADGYANTEFSFRYSPNDQSDTNKKGILKIEHGLPTPLPLIGLQVWRPALLLADLAMHWGETGLMQGMNVLELGAGTGLASIAAGMYAKKVICTDYDCGDILQLIKRNMETNKRIIKAEFVTKEIDFTKVLADDVLEELKSINIIFAPDLIYDKDLTEAFLKMLQIIMDIPPKKIVLMAVEKRYVIKDTRAEPISKSYEAFLKIVKKYMKPQWVMKEITNDIPQYFTYKRTKDLVLWKIAN